MIARFAVSSGSAAVVVFGLLLLMQTMIAIAPSALTHSAVFRLVDFVRVETEPRAPERRERPDPVAEPLQPPDRPRTDLGGDTGLRVGPVPPTPPPFGPQGPQRFAMADGDRLPIVKVAPLYPPAAIRRELEGYVVVRFTVTRSGAVADAVVEESSNAVFERAALDAVAKWRYRPRVVDGEAVEVPGVRHQVTFELEN